jgi:phage terminase large subunit
VDEDTLNEMITFVRDENMKEQADAGAHDDCVMALAIAFAIRGQQTRDKSNDVAGIRVSWTEDMYEDYWNAPYDQQVMLLQRWGNPF